MEINSHSLTYLPVLVEEKKITEEALNVSLFNSQICESTFRAARSMSGSFSSVVNFSVNKFLQRVEKLGILRSIQWSSDTNVNNIIFPKHHKHSQKTFSTGSTSKTAIAATTTVITEELLEEIAFKTYLHAEEILSNCGIPFLNPNRNMMSFEEVNRLAHVS